MSDNWDWAVKEGHITEQERQNLLHRERIDRQRRIQQEVEKIRTLAFWGFWLGLGGSLVGTLALIATLYK